LALRSSCGRILAAALLLVLPPLASAGKPAKPAGENVDQFIVKFKDGTPERGNAVARQRVLDAGASEVRRRATPVSRMGIGADVVRLDGKLSRRSAEAFMNRLRRNPSVAWVQVDNILKPTLSPNDSLYPGNQWHYYEPVGGINLPPAWDLSTGSGVVVGVIDTGVTAHSDLNANIVPGYDFITSTLKGNDGGGRDTDPSDPGDWTAVGECGDGDPAEPEDSSWHGTHVAGTVAAVTNNALGVAGVAFNAKVMPLRALGKCGGATSDIADAITWASGGTGVTGPGLPAVNPNPVEVLNLSLGGASPACSPATQAAIDGAVSRGVVVVVAAGNDSDDASGYEPANCGGVIVVGATTRSGGRADYSNFGPLVTVSAPGGGRGAGGTLATGIASTSNNGTTVPTTETYLFYQGTSMASPHVAGVVALMQAAATSTPGAVAAVLSSTARPLEIACPEGCGAGIVNAAAAIGAATGGALTVNDRTVYEGNAGNKVVSFTVSLSKPMAGPVSFSVATANGTATAGADYVAIPPTARTIPAGQTSLQVDVTVLGDTAIEPDETFSLVVSGVSGIAVADGTGTGRIVNDDPIMLANGTPTGPLGASTGQYFLYAIDVPAGASNLSITTAGGTGDADLYVRFNALPTLSVADCISRGETTAETCTFATPSAGRYYIMVLAYTTISNVVLTAGYSVPAGPSLAVGDASVAEGNAGTKVLSFPVSLSAAATGTVTFDASTQPGSAAPGSDYVALAATGLSIPAGQVSATVNVTINGDTIVEGNETFVLELANISGATAGDTQGQGRINNDDAAQLRIADATMAEGNSGARSMVFEVLLSQALPNPVTFNVATSNGSAVAGSDYSARSQTGRYLDAGRTRQVFDVPILGDTSAEGHETFTVTLSGVSGAVLSGASATGTILNDDAGGASAGGSARITSVSSAPVLVLDMDGKVVSDDDATPACRPAGQRRGRLEPVLPKCTPAQAEARAKRAREH
jgi:serine protease